MLQKNKKNVHKNAPKNCNIIFYALKLWWLYCYCCLCLLTELNMCFAYGTHSETDDLINELDRPSEY